MKLKLLLALLRRAFAHVPGADQHINWLLDHQHHADASVLDDAGGDPPPDLPPNT